MPPITSLELEETLEARGSWCVEPLSSGFGAVEMPSSVVASLVLVASSIEVLHVS